MYADDLTAYNSFSMYEAAFGSQQTSLGAQLLSAFESRYDADPWRYPGDDLGSLKARGLRSRADSREPFPQII